MAKKTQAQIEFKAVTTEFNNGIKEMNSTIKTMSNELKLNSAQLKNNADDVNLLQQRQDILQREYEASTTKIEHTENALKEAARLLGENSREYQTLYNALLRAKTQQQAIQNEIKSTTDRIENLNNSVEDTSAGLNKFGGGFTIAKGALASFAGNMLANAVSKVGELASSLFELNEETKEFRTNMAKLQGATSQYSYSTDYANSKIRELYGYLNDDQMAVNSISNLQGLKLSEEELTKTLDAGIAVWTAYGDSIPIESLTESMNESAQVGKVIGSLADALNWAGISEDEFNNKLAKCSSTSERAKLITDTLMNAYGKSKETYDKNTESIRENNEANMALIQSQAELGEAIEPIDTLFTNLKANILSRFIPAAKLASDNIQSFIGKIGNISSIGDLLDIGLEFANSIQENAPILVASGMDLLKNLATGIADALPTIIEKVPTIVKTLADTISTLFPIILVKGMQIIWELGKGLIKAIPTLVANIPKIASAIFSVWSAVNWMNLGKNLITGVVNGIKGMRGNLLNNIKTLLNNLKNNFSGGFNSIKTMASNSWNSIKNAILNPLNTAKNSIKSIINKIKGFFNFKISWPKIPLPHFNISPRGWKVGDLLKGSIPKLGIQWYAKGGIMTQPTLFGGGEKGDEAILPLNPFYDYLDNKLNTVLSSINSNFIDYDKLTDSFITAIEKIDIKLDSDKVGRVLDKKAGINTILKERGLV